MLADELPDKQFGDDAVRALSRVACGGRCCDFVDLGPQDRRVFDPIADTFDGDDLGMNAGLLEAQRSIIFTSKLIYYQ